MNKSLIWQAEKTFNYLFIFAFLFLRKAFFNFKLAGCKFLPQPTFLSFKTTYFILLNGTQKLRFWLCLPQKNLTFSQLFWATLLRFTLRKIRLLDFTSGSSRVTSFQKCKNALFPFRSAFTLAHYVRFHLTSVLRKIRYSTVTDFARFLGWSTSFPKYSAIWYAKSCNITIFKAGETISEISGIKTKSLKIAWCFSSI